MDLSYAVPRFTFQFDSRLPLVSRAGGILQEMSDEKKPYANERVCELMRVAGRTHQNNAMPACVYELFDLLIRQQQFQADTALALNERMDALMFGMKTSADKRLELLKACLPFLVAPTAKTLVDAIQKEIQNG